jgi:hypothetical protein
MIGSRKLTRWYHNSIPASDELINGTGILEPCVAECDDMLEFTDKFALGGVKFLSSVTRGCSE